MDISILLKEKKLEREEDITGYLDITIQGGCLIEINASREPFGFSMDAIGSTRRPTIVNKLGVTALQRIMTPSFVSLGMFALVVPYLFAVRFVTMMTA